MSTATSILVATLWVTLQAATGPPATLDVAEKRWQNLRPAVYEFSVEVRCFCGPRPQGPVWFQVAGTTASPREPLDPSTQRVYARYDTIDKLFTAIRLAIANGGYKTDVEYDAGLGFPVRADLDPRQSVFDDELFFRVAGFRIVEPTTK